MFSLPILEREKTVVYTTVQAWLCNILNIGKAAAAAVASKEIVLMVNTQFVW